MGKYVIVNDKMQSNYSYELVCDAGENFAEDFKPELPPMKCYSLEYLKENT